MKYTMIVLSIALVLAPVLSIESGPHHTAWGGQYAHWHPSDSRAEAIWIAYADAPPPLPADTWCPVWDPWLCKGDRPPLRVN